MGENKNVEIMLKNIGMVYRTNDNRDVTALTSVNLDIQKGEFVSLVGPSGCGKTTLLRIIADLIKPTSGEIKIAGETPCEARLKRRYGIVFQGAVLYEWRTVIKNIMLPLEIMNVPKSEREERAKKMLELVGLSEFANHYPGQLSGGMQQRVGIARALAIQPEILLMDEPFGALDEILREQLDLETLGLWENQQNHYFCNSQYFGIGFLIRQGLRSFSAPRQTLGGGRYKPSASEDNGTESNK